MNGIFLTCLAGSFLTNPVAAAMLPAPSTVFWATAATPVTTAPLTWVTPVTVLPATTGTKEEERGGWCIISAEPQYLRGLAGRKVHKHDTDLTILDFKASTVIGRMCNLSGAALW